MRFFLPSKSSGPKVGDPSYESGRPKVGDVTKKKRAAGLHLTYGASGRDPPPDPHGGRPQVWPVGPAQPRVGLHREARG